MKIRNEKVEVKIGNKVNEFKNLILNEYLKRFVLVQTDETKMRNLTRYTRLNYCLLKFDTPFENLNINTELHNQDFDICFVMGAVINQEYSEKQISAKYIYNTEDYQTIWDYSKSTAYGISLSDYYNKKITAIGFNSTWMNDSSTQTKVPVCAVLDTTNYNLYLQKNQELSIVRKDIISTDASFWGSSDEVKCPVHLCPLGIDPLLEQPLPQYFDSYQSKGIIYSVGFSHSKNKMDIEYVIDKDIEIEEQNNKLILKGIPNPPNSIARVPSNRLFPSSKCYPGGIHYSYVIIKYKLWQDLVISETLEGEQQIVPTDTGRYYYQILDMQKVIAEEGNIILKYERG